MTNEYINTDCSDPQIVHSSFQLFCSGVHGRSYRRRVARVTAVCTVSLSRECVTEPSREVRTKLPCLNILIVTHNQIIQAKIDKITISAVISMHLKSFLFY